MRDVSTIRGLSLTQPWASAVALGHKKVETRSFRVSYRGPIAIHASKAFPREAQEFAITERDRGRCVGQLPLGQIVAIANLVGEHVQDAELMMAGSVVTVLPVMLVFLFLQRYYIRGITAGSVK